MRRLMLVLLAGLPAAGCSHPAHPPDEEAAERARREERQRIMREYWYERTLAPADEASLPPDTAVDYPAGTYGGLRFGPRRGSGPGLEEPVRK